jgi:CheY-like chemotaxis protein
VIDQKDKWILYIDDDKDDREIFCEVLNAVDSKVDCVCRSNASDAIALLNGCLTLPQYIFLDINMPGIDGIECLKKIRANARLFTIPVVIMSTSPHHPAMAAISNLNASFIRKPSSYKLFIENVRSVLMHCN